MKVRKLAVALALAGGLGSGLAQALGMGEGRMLTNLNEPLRAEIELSEPGELSADQIKVSLASEADFERAGLRRMDVLRRLEFEVVEVASGYQIQVTSDGPIREPFLNFLVELTWPNGRLLREYSFLVDPPSRSTDQQAIGPTADTGSGDTRTGQQRRDAAEPERQQAPSRRAGEAPDEYGPTGTDDTLWGIAGQVSPSGDLSRHQVMLAIQEANPNAFMNNNINQLRRGQVLRIPSEEAMRSRSRQEAIQQVMAQNERHQQGSGQAAAGADAPGASSQTSSAATSQAAGSSSGADGGDELRILVADDGSNGEDGTTAGMGDGEGDERLAAALEELDRAERDREELSERLADLEDQIKTMSQLIELKDDQLAEMEQRLAKAREEAGESSGAATRDDGGETQPEGETVAGGDDTGKADAGATDAQSGTDMAADSGGSDGAAAGSQDSEGAAQTEPETEQAAAAASGKESQGGDPATQPEPEPEQADQAEGAGQPSTSETGGEAPPTSLSDFFQRIINDPRYQIGAGALGIALLALLWGLARRNAAREQAFYDQLKDVSDSGEALDEDEDILELGESGEEAVPESGETDTQDGGEDDALAEADVYLAYGRHGQAVQHLEDAISSEPSRVDLRLKLLEVYADAGQPENFEKQYRELSAFNDDEALRSADELRSRLDSSGEDLSLDELSEQLKTGTGPESAQGDEPEDEDDFDFSALEEADSLVGDDSGATTSEGTDDSGSDDFAIDFDLEDDEALDESLAGGTGTSSGGAEREPSTSDEADDDVADLGFSMDDLELEEPGGNDAQAAGDADVPELDVSSETGEDEAGIDFESFEATSTESDETARQSSGGADELALDDLELEMGTEDTATEAGTTPTGDSDGAEAESAAETSSFTDFDDSFLEELDAELDRVTEEESDASAPEPSGTETTAQEPAPPPEPAGDELDDLSLDVSDEDLELADEVAQVAQEGGGEDAEASSDQFEESLMDSDIDDLGAESELSDDELAALEGEEAGQGQGMEEEGADMGSDSGAASAGQGDAGAESDSSAADDEFDFLEGTDESGTKLDLARAYVEMGDADGARDILEEVAREGSEEQQQEAQRLLNEL